MVRILATILLSHVSRPSMKDCELVAKDLVHKFPFLEEYVCPFVFTHVFDSYSNYPPVAFLGSVCLYSLSKL